VPEHIRQLHIHVYAVDEHRRGTAFSPPYWTRSPMPGRPEPHQCFALVGSSVGSGPSLTDGYESRVGACRVVLPDQR